MTSVSEKLMLSIAQDDLARFHKALERARYYHPVVRQLWLQMAGILAEAKKQRDAAEKTK